MGEGVLSDVSIEPELHATSDAVLATLDRLRTLELEKRDLPVGSPRLVELAKEIERLATTVLGASDAQVDLAKAAARRGGCRNDRPGHHDQRDGRSSAQRPDGACRMA